MEISVKRGEDSISILGPHSFVEEWAKRLLPQIGMPCGNFEAGQVDPELSELYRKYGSTTQQNNVLLFVYYYNVVKQQAEVSYDAIRNAFKAVGVKAGNVLASVNALKLNKGYVESAGRGMVKITSKGLAHLAVDEFVEAI